MGMMTELEHPITGEHRVVGPIVRMSRTPTVAAKPSPPLGHHSREILSEAGYSVAEIDEMVAAGVISDTA
jgi:crotonobetainyl-CoA:carnitine CoA-transferase CaiB-like acyl-CoA transferase